MTHRPAPDLSALAAQLRLMALGLLAELMELVGLGALAAGLRRRMGRELAALERFATGVIVLMALRSAPNIPGPAPSAHPRRAPRGFAWVAANANAMRAMQRKLFPKLRDLRARLARFDALLDDAAGAAQRMLRHIARIPPAARLVLLDGIAGFQPATKLADAPLAANDSS